jgi:hypothetical protein
MELLYPSVVIFLQGFCSIDHVSCRVIMPFHSNSVFVRHPTVQQIPCSFFASRNFVVEAVFVPHAFWFIKCSSSKQTSIMSNSYIPGQWGSFDQIQVCYNIELRCSLGVSSSHVSKLLTHLRVNGIEYSYLSPANFDFGSNHFVLGWMHGSSIK